MSSKCTSLTTKKKPCSRNAMNGSQFCKQHCPKTDITNDVDDQSLAKPVSRLEQLRRSFDSENRRMSETHRKMLDETLAIPDTRKKVMIVPTFAYLNRMKQEAMKNKPVEMLLEEMVIEDEPEPSDEESCHGEIEKEEDLSVVEGGDESDDDNE